MIVLGFNGGRKRADQDDVFNWDSHDAAAALVHDGKVVAAVEEERLNRIKHTNCFPANAIRYCLSSAGLGLESVDAITYVCREDRLSDLAQRAALVDMAEPIPKDARAFMAALFQREFGMDVSAKLRFCEHHDAHLWSAFALSGFSEALVLSIDGMGDDRSGRVCTASGNVMTPLRDYATPQSLGLLYAGLIRLVGYSFFDEYKAMGLAPYGDPSVYKELFDAGRTLLPDGDYVVDYSYKWEERFKAAGILQQARRKGEPFTQVHMNLAAGLQAMLEEIVLHILRHYQQKTGLKNLCLAGGVAHNCTLNGKILYSGLFDKVFVQPAAHDAGGTVGAGYWTLSTQPSVPTSKPLRHVFLGPDIGENDDIGSRLTAWADLVTCEHHTNIAKTAARLLADGAVLGWVQGRSEFGPRALGNRSILADPRPAENKDRINQMVKKREQFRPFAPSVVAERAHEFFELPNCEADLSYMTYALRVQEAKRPLLGAITHVDGSARIQVVPRDQNPRYWELLIEFEKLTGIPILLNTSFNNNAEPIVDSIDDAVAAFLTTGLDYLVVGNHLVRKRKVQNRIAAYRGLVPSLPPIRRIVGYKTNGTITYLIESTKTGAYTKRPATEVSQEVFALLSNSNNLSLAESLKKNRIKGQAAQKVVEELNELWAKRMLTLQPQKQPSCTVPSIHSKAS